MEKGTISFWINHGDQDWATNRREYKFGPFEQGAVGISVFKYADRIMEVRFAAEHFGHTFRGSMPEASEKGVHIAVSWENEVSLYVNGSKVGFAPFKPTAH